MKPPVGVRSFNSFDLIKLLSLPRPVDPKYELRPFCLGHISQINVSSSVYLPVVVCS